jgi:hypothetical protein
MLPDRQNDRPLESRFGWYKMPRPDTSFAFSLLLPDGIITIFSNQVKINVVTFSQNY